MTQTSLIVPGFLLAGVALWVLVGTVGVDPGDRGSITGAFAAELHQQRRAGPAGRLS